VLLRPLKHLLWVPCAAFPPSLWLRSRPYSVVPTVHVPLRPFSAFCGPSCRACPQPGSYRPFGFVFTVHLPLRLPLRTFSAYCGLLVPRLPSTLAPTIPLASFTRRERPSRPLTPFSTPYGPSTPFQHRLLASTAPSTPPSTRCVPLPPPPAFDAPTANFCARR
jgi:hypothetical protein